MAWNNATGAIVVPAPISTPYDLGRPLSTTKLVHDIICYHTMVGTLNGSLSGSSQSGSTYWHFGLNAQGVMKQCQDLRYKSAANLNGNWHVIPIETSDRNEGVWPIAWEPRPWTQAQLDRLVQLTVWLCKRFNIPATLIPDTKPGRRGLAYHRQGIDPWRVAGGEKWSNSTGKTCPTDPRINQIKNYIIPKVQAVLITPTPPTGDWLDMATQAEVAALLKTYTSGWLVRPKLANGTIDKHVYIVASDFSSKFWIGGWENVKVLDFLENLNDAGTEAGHPKPYNFDSALIDQIPEKWNPIYGYSWAHRDPPGPPPAGESEELPPVEPPPTPNP